MALLGSTRTGAIKSQDKVKLKRARDTLHDDILGEVERFSGKYRSARRRPKPSYIRVDDIPQDVYVAMVKGVTGPGQYPLLVAFRPVLNAGSLVIEKADRLQCLDVATLIEWYVPSEQSIEAQHEHIATFRHDMLPRFRNL